MSFKSVYDLFNDALKSMDLPDKYSDLSLFIDDDNKCLEFIKFLINDIGFDENQKLAKSRAKHSVINFLFGKILSEFGNLFDSIPRNQHQKSSDKIWLYTALYHDYGYFSKYIYDEKYQISDLIKHNNVLADNYDNDLSTLNYFTKRYPNVLHFTYNEIAKYYDFSKDFHRNRNDDEKIDHGIVGGILLFDRLTAANPKIKSDYFDIKTAALTICQHNIFKSNSSTDDELYKEHGLIRLFHDSNLVISEETPLLLFLSLVDTIECTKRFNKENKYDTYFQTKTILKELKIDVSSEYIILDLSSLETRSKKKEGVSEKYDSYIRGLLGFNNWTQFSAKQDENLITISLRPIGSIYTENKKYA